MQVPIQVTFRNVKHSSVLIDHVNEKAEKLNKFAENIISCQVVIEFESKHLQTGNLYNTRLVVTVPGKELVSTHNHNENMYVTIREAFDDMSRMLEDYSHILHGRVKHHCPIIEGTVARVFDKGFGFIETANGDEYYFHTDNVLHPRTGQLKVGEHVRFIEHMGDQGMQAHRVTAHRRDQRDAA